MSIRLLAALALSWVAVGTAEPIVAGETCSTRTVLTALAHGQFKAIRRTSDLPERVVAEFWRLHPDGHGPRSFANPDSSFQATDVLDGGRPQRRLIFGGSASSLAFIYYELGGWGRSLQLFIVCSDTSGAHTFSYPQPLERRKARNPSELFTRLVPECLASPAREDWQPGDAVCTADQRSP